MIDSVCLPLPDYLWGIETTWLQRYILCRSCFQTTYEELKPALVKWLKMKPRLPDYLWGIETFFFLMFSSSLLWRFQTTYEELKHLSPVPCVNHAAGFQTTYEELKLLLPVTSSVASLSLPDYLWGIETGREESRMRSCRASRLPMRNWNLFSSKEEVLYFARLPDYLWGIETF